MEKIRSVHIVTSYIPSADVETNFISALKVSCKHKDASLHIVECDANYIGDYEDPYQIALKEELRPHLVEKDAKLNDNLFISAYSSNINIIDPLQGMESDAAALGCFIMGFPRLRWKTVPRMLRESSLPRAIWCSGSISRPHYKATKSGRRMSRYHEIGAVVVEILDNEKFNVRQIEWDGKGFYDRKEYFTANGVEVHEDAVVAMTLGDLHPPFICPIVKEKTKKLLEELSPKNVFVGDYLDAASVSHHLVGKNISKAVFDMSLEQEGGLSARVIQEHVEASPKSNWYLVASNHPEHLVRYLEEGRYLNDPTNHILALELAYIQAKEGNAIEYFLRTFWRKNGLMSKVTFTKRKESVRIAGIEMNDHGDYSSNGAKGSTKEKGVTYGGKVNSAHTHSPCRDVFGNCVAGTSTTLTMPYTNDSGSSSWLNSHIVTYKNGARTHENVLLN